jgi:hypothetical protein
MSTRAPEPSGDTALVVTLTLGQLRAMVREEIDRAVEEVEGPPALIDTNALSRHLGVSSRTVFELRKQGLPVVWLCDSPRFELGACLDWLKARKAPEGKAA